MITHNEQLYAFDLRGYLLVENVINKETLEEANRIADRYENLDPTTGKPNFNNPNVYRFPKIVLDERLFLEIALSKKIIKLLPDLIIDPRLKSTWLDFKKKGGGISFHSNHTPYNPVEAYHFHHRIMANLVTVCYAFKDIPENGGALEVIPGSHKSNFEIPSDETLLKELRIKLPMKAGSALIFSHDINHGSLNDSLNIRRCLFTSFGTTSSANTQGDDTLYDSVFSSMPENSFEKFLVRRPAGDGRGYNIKINAQMDEVYENNRM